MMAEYQHVEAFCLMTYACRNGHREVIWNSRDGVTPFIVHCATCGAEAQHVDWQRDTRIPTYQPRPGERMFVTMTPHDAEALAREMVVRYWDHPEYLMREGYANEDEAVRRLAKGYCDPPGQPRIVVMGGEPPINTTHGPDGRRLRFA